VRDRRRAPWESMGGTSTAAPEWAGNGQGDQPPGSRRPAGHATGARPDGFSPHHRGAITGARSPGRAVMLVGDVRAGEVRESRARAPVMGRRGSLGPKDDPRSIPAGPAARHAAAGSPRSPPQSRTPPRPPRTAPRRIRREAPTATARHHRRSESKGRMRRPGPPAASRRAWKAGCRSAASRVSATRASRRESRSGSRAESTAGRERPRDRGNRRRDDRSFGVSQATSQHSRRLPRRRGRRQFDGGPS
jgi:hypothetical protein